MANAITFKWMLLILICMPLSNMLVGFLTRRNILMQCVSMTIVSIFYILVVIAISIFFIKVGPIKITLCEVGMFSIDFALEPLGVIFLSLLSCMWFISIIYTYTYISHLSTTYPYNLYQLYIAACIASSSLVAVAGNPVTMFIFYEMLTLCTIPMIPNHEVAYSRYTTIELYLRPLLYPSLLFFLPAVILLNLGYNTLLTILLCIFGISKTAIFPFHTWITTAMVAIHPVSALLHGVAVVNTGIFVLCKIILYTNWSFKLPMEWLVLIPSITIVFASIKAILVTDLKKFLAYSTIAQLSICLLGVLTLSKNGVISSIIFIFAHSFAKIALFFIAGNIYLLTKKYAINSLKGLIYEMPISVICFIISSLSLVGAPFIAGGVGKSAILLAASEANNKFAEYSVYLATILTFTYMSRVIYTFCIKSTDDNIEIDSVNSNFMLLPVLICISVVVSFMLIIYPILSKILAFL